MTPMCELSVKRSGRGGGRGRSDWIHWRTPRGLRVAAAAAVTHFPPRTPRRFDCRYRRSAPDNYRLQTFTTYGTASLDWLPPAGSPVKDRTCAPPGHGKVSKSNAKRRCRCVPRQRRWVGFYFYNGKFLTYSFLNWNMRSWRALCSFRTNFKLIYFYIFLL